MEQTKKRKYKLIANNESVNQFYNGSTTTNCNSTGNSSDQSLVKDRSELLKLVSNFNYNILYNIIIIQYSDSTKIT